MESVAAFFALHIGSTCDTNVFLNPSVYRVYLLIVFILIVKASTFSKSSDVGLKVAAALIVVSFMLWLLAKASDSCHPTHVIMIMFYVTVIMILVFLLYIYVFGSKKNEP